MQIDTRSAEQATTTIDRLVETQTAGCV